MTILRVGALKSNQIAHLDPEVVLWAEKIASASPSNEYPDATCLAIADAFMKTIKAQTFNTKLKAIYPFLCDSGNDQAAVVQACTPLRGGNTAFNYTSAPGSFTLAGGADFTGAGSATIITNEQPQMLGNCLSGSTNAGGFGWYELNFVNTGASVMGSLNGGSSAWNLYALGPTGGTIIWGNPANFPSRLPAAGISAGARGHWYGQRVNKSLMENYYNGGTLAGGTGEGPTTNTTANDTSTQGSVATMTLFGWWRVDTGAFDSYYKGQCALAYFTDGTFTAAEVALWHAIIEQFLIGPTGR